MSDMDLDEDDDVEFRLDAEVFDSTVRDVKENPELYESLAG